MIEMKVVLQVVDNAKVDIFNKEYNSIGAGYLLLVGIEKEDNESKVKEMAKKISKLRVFKDENGKTNLDISAKQEKFRKDKLISLAVENIAGYEEKVDAAKESILEDYLIKKSYSKYYSIFPALPFKNATGV